MSKLQDLHRDGGVEVTLIVNVVIPDDLGGDPVTSLCRHFPFFTSGTTLRPDPSSKERQH